MFRIFLACACCLVSYSTFAGNKIVYYFNRPVDNSVSTGKNAVYLNNCLGDTLAAYINRARYTLDIAVYNYTATAPVGNLIATAINNAYTRGVKIRWIYDGSQSNSGLPLLNTAINKLGSPTTSAYTIMHNKFMIVDANSSDPSDAVVWTGSTNWNTQQFNYDYNNTVVIQDSAVAHAYRAQFNMMWGDTGIVPNASLSKFGAFKTDLGNHSFIVEGKTVEVYFSPADGTNTKIVAAINSANADMYFGMYTFTENSSSAALVSKNSSGVYVAGIVDNATVSSSGSEYGALNSGLGAAKFKVFPGSDLYHNKYLIVDPSDKCSQPLVLTGSHNWSVSANTKNDENTVIIRNDTAANIYYQSFRANFTAAGGLLPAITGCPTAAEDLDAAGISPFVFPNPSTGKIAVQYNSVAGKATEIRICDIYGRVVSADHFIPWSSGATSWEALIDFPGIYLLQVVTADDCYTRKFIIEP
ncbi:MAG: phospholipase D-like domain-containing protein [Bacteroidota bacterium]